jgi:hypothetical protein
MVDPAIFCAAGAAGRQRWSLRATGTGLDGGRRCAAGDFPMAMVRLRPGPMDDCGPQDRQFNR